MGNDICTEVGGRIRHFRKARGHTLESFSRLLHRSKSVLSKYERGDVALDIVTLQEIALALDVPIAALLENSGRMSAPLYSSRGDAAAEQQFERYYCYSIMSYDKATLQKSLLIMGSDTATCYMNIDSEENVQHYEFLFSGKVRRSDSFTRLFLTNALHDDDTCIMEIPARLGDYQCTIAFVVNFPVGGRYPLAGTFLLSTVPIRDTKWIYDALCFTRDDLKRFQYHNAYFAVQNYTMRILELRRPD